MIDPDALFGIIVVVRKRNKERTIIVVTDALSSFVVISTEGYRFEIGGSWRLPNAHLAAAIRETLP